MSTHRRGMSRDPLRARLIALEQEMRSIAHDADARYWADKVAVLLREPPSDSFYVAHCDQLSDTACDADQHDFKLVAWYRHERIGHYCWKCGVFRPLAAVMLDTTSVTLPLL